MDTAQHKKASILLADDDPFITSLYRERLTRAGHTVDTVQNGEEAIKRIQETPPDLLVLDLNMPRMDGAAVLQFIRQQSGTPQLPVIVLSNACARDYLERINQLGPSRFLMKYSHPPQKVFEEIQAVLDEAQSGGVVKPVPAKVEEVQLAASVSIPVLLEELSDTSDVAVQQDALLRLYRTVQESEQKLKTANPLSLTYQFGTALGQLFEEAYAQPLMLSKKGSAIETLRIGLRALDTWLSRIGDGPATPEPILIVCEDKAKRQELHEQCNRPGFFPLVTTSEKAALDLVANNVLRLVLWNTRRGVAARRTLRTIRKVNSRSDMRILFLIPGKELSSWNAEIHDSWSTAVATPLNTIELLAALYAWRL